MKSHIARTIAGAFMIFISRGAFAVCPSVSIDIPDIPAVCLGETIEVAPVLDEIPGDCNGMVTYPYKRWWWSVAGVGIVASNNSLPARFTPLSSGEGTIRFDLICRSRQCPDCNQNFSAERKFNVVHVGIAQSNCMVCWKETAAYLSVDPDTHAPDGVRWTSRPHGIYGEGNSVEFDPSRLTSHRYTVTAKNDGHPNCSDVCEVHVVKVAMSESERFLSAEDSEATLSLSSDSYSPGGYVWSSEPAGISSNGPNASIVFVPSNLPPGKYVVRCSSADFSDCYDECEVYILKVELVPDWNHDRKIDDQDREQATALNPYRFWINDDRDDGDVASGNSDVPGQSDGNASDDKVNGRCDLLDFFPVWLDLGQALALLPPGETIQYKLNQANGAIKAVYTELDNDRAGKYLIEDGNKYGPLFNQDSFAANVFEVTSASVVLENHFLQEIYANTNKGVLMFEGKIATANPLVLEILKNNQTIYRKILPISLSSVEDMYRWINLRPGRSADSRPGPPDNFPDVLSNNKNFVFVHGYSVDEQSARAWNSEVFKRMYWSGSRARFHAVTWFGNDSQMHIPFLGDLTPDYHVNVIHAFEAASNLAAYICSFNGEKIVAAHSLGNMVVSATIQDRGMNASKYYMIDAAVASEAYDGDPSVQSPDMVHSEWDGYQTRLYCANWHTNFPSDQRRNLTWADRFENAVGDAYNFYSSGEDTLATHAHNNPPGLLDVGIFSEVHEYAWALQEKLKGRMWVSWMGGGSTYGGWGFNSSHYWIHFPEDTVNITQGELLLYPFFTPGSGEIDDLYSTNSATASVFAQNNNVDLLAAFIPALSLPTGANHVPEIENSGGGNFNMQAVGPDPGYQNGWPDVRTRNEAYGTRWLHSDFKDIAFSFVYPLFKEFTILGGLDEQ